ncbi:MAG TPA: hypothetical protein VHR47_13920 [Bacillota bacterium]|nr:hypothetical protein [Bacillota bacterium]
MGSPLDEGLTGRKIFSVGLRGIKNINVSRSKVIHIGWTDRFFDGKIPSAKFGDEIGASRILDRETSLFVLGIGILDGVLNINVLWMNINVRE